QLVELPHLAMGSPTQIAIAAVPQIHTGNLLETARRIEPRGELVGDPFILDEAVLTRQADGLFVKVDCIERAAFDAGALRTDQRNAVLEILRAIRRPYLELSVVRDQSLDMLLALVCRCGVAGCSAGQRAVEVILRRFEM